MAIVVYKCDVCKREKEFRRNFNGLETIQRCTITHGCRGKFYQIDKFDDYLRATAPDPAAGLDEWRQRKVLHNHTQSIARNSWEIKHNLGVYPAISVFVSVPSEDNPDNIEEILPTDIVIVDENNIILRFDKVWAGITQLVARQSDPNLLNPIVEVIEDTSVLQQISIGGEIAIATRIATVGEAPVIDLATSYTTTQNSIVTHTYMDVNDSLPNSVSPWNDINKVVIRGKLYTIRSYSGITSAMLDETISSGSTFRYTGIDDHIGSPGVLRDIQQDEVYILFATTPFENIDKNVNNYIDVFDVTETDNIFSFVYDSGEFFAESAIIQKIYPPIRSVE